MKTGTVLKQEGINRSTNKGLIDWGVTTVKIFSRRKDPTFTSDDFRFRARQQGFDLDGQAVGALISRLAQKKVIERVGEQQSSIRSNHARRVLRWTPGVGVN